MQASVSLSYTAKDSTEFLYLVNSLNSLGVSVNTNVSQPQSKVVTTAMVKQMGPLESYYIKTTGKSMRASPGLDREEVARERLVSIGVNLATIIAIKNDNSETSQITNDVNVSNGSGSVFGAFDDISDEESTNNPVSDEFDENVHYIAEDPSAEPF